MIGTIVISLLSTYIIGMVLLAIYSYTLLDFYKKQGIKTEYHPLIGFFKYFIYPKGSLDQLEAMKELYAHNCNADLVVANSITGTASIVLLLGRDIITEFFNKELKITKKKSFDKHVNFGFIDQSGEDALRKRSLFKQFFHQENLSTIFTQLHSIIQKHIAKIEEENWPEGADRNEFKVVDFSTAMDNLFADIVDFILMGNEKGSTVDGKRVSTAIKDTIDII